MDNHDLKYMVESQQFLEVFHPHSLYPGENDLVEIRSYPQVDSICSIWGDNPSSIVNAGELLVGWNKRRGAIGFSQGRRIGESTLGDDTKPGLLVTADSDTGIPLEVLLKEAKEKGLPEPTAGVSTSPGNAQLHWKVKTPAATVAELCLIQEGIADLLGTCQGVNISSQLFKLPGPFVNVKEGKRHHRVALLFLHPDRVYDLSLFPRAEGVLEDKPPPAGFNYDVGSVGDFTEKVIKEGIPDGTPRRKTIFAIQTDMWVRKNPLDEIKETSRQIAERAGLSGKDLEDVTERQLRNVVKQKKPTAFPREDEAPTLVGMTPAQTTTAGNGNVNDEFDNQIESVSRRSNTPWPDFPALGFSHSIVKEIIDKVHDKTWGDLAAIGAQTMAIFGNVIGRGPHVYGGEDKHYSNLFLGIIGTTSEGKKGSGLGVARKYFQPVDETWLRDRVVKGISTGEGLIHAIRDPVEKWSRKDDAMIVVDPGIDDKRLMGFFTEFSTILKVSKRDGNTLPGTLRQAWDNEDIPLGIKTKNFPETATDPHFSMIAHAVPQELQHLMDSTSHVYGGDFNRILWCCSRKNPIPRTHRIRDISSTCDRIRDAVDFSRALGDTEVELSPECDAYWNEDIVPNRKLPGGDIELICGRADPQTLRLALILALMRKSNVIEMVDLQAAMDWWMYFQNSAQWIFQCGVEASPLDHMADQVFDLVRRQPGISRSQIYRTLRCDNRRNGLQALIKTLNLLESHGRLRSSPQTSGGREREIWNVNEGTPVVVTTTAPVIPVVTTTPPTEKFAHEQIPEEAAPKPKKKSKKKTAPKKKLKLTPKGEIPNGTYDLNDFVEGLGNGSE